MKPRNKKPSLNEMGFSKWPFKNPFKKEAHKDHDHDHGNTPPKNVEIYTIAVVLDGEVWEVLRAQEKLADLFLANPTFILVTDETGTPKIGMKYEDEQFRQA